jgi:hypothetical protein
VITVDIANVKAVLLGDGNWYEVVPGTFTPGRIDFVSNGEVLVAVRNPHLEASTAGFSWKESDGTMIAVQPNQICAVRY